MNHVLCCVMLIGSLAAVSCGSPQASRSEGPKSPDTGPKLDVPEEWHDPESVYTMARAPMALHADDRDARVNESAPAIAVVGGTILTAAGKRHDRGVLILTQGRIQHVGDEGSAKIPAGATVIDATGRFVTPGIIDTHSHLGVYPAPHVSAHRDGNEITVPITSQVRAEYGYWPNDPAITRALAGGVTAALILPGSANLVGGLGFTVVMRPGRTAEEVRFPGAPATIKMACGENPKRVYGSRGGPFTRMGLYAAFRDAFFQARELQAKLAAYERRRALWLRKRDRAAELDAAHREAGKSGAVKPEAAPEPPGRDAKLEALASVLRGEVLAQVHCYRADEIRQMVAIADEFGFSIRSFHHALEAYKVRDLLAERGIGVSTWADWWGFKMEAFDGIPENAALIFESGGRPVIHSDSSVGIQRLNQEVAKAMYAGRNAGIEISDDDALRWITANAAWVLGIDEVTGTLEPGKRADVVVWSHHPLSVYARADVVIQGGEMAYERSRGRPITDFELGNSAAHRDMIEAPGAATVTGGAR